MFTTTRGTAVAPAMMNRSKYKLVFLGDTPVGKSSIVNRYVYDQFEYHPYPTVGIDFISKTMYLKDRLARLLIWDTTGNERFRSLTPSYIRDSHAAIIVYDVTDRASFFNAAMWIDLARASCGRDHLIILVGNKADLADKRQVGTREGEEQAKMDGVKFMECSAKTGDNVQNLFQTIVTSLVEKDNEVKNAADENAAKNDTDAPDSTVDPKNDAGGWCGCITKLLYAHEVDEEDL